MIHHGEEELSVNARRLLDLIRKYAPEPVHYIFAEQQLGLSRRETIAANIELGHKAYIHTDADKNPSIIPYVLTAKAQPPVYDPVLMDTLDWLIKDGAQLAPPVHATLGLRAGTIVLLTGEPKRSGKTTFMRHMLAAAVNSREFLDCEFARHPELGARPDRRPYSPWVVRYLA
jgi:hypothetical protein